MGQVPALAGTPAHHLLVGSGRLSRHFAKYFSDLHAEGILSYETWTTPREFSADFFRNFRATHVWILVSDRAIAPVAARIREGLVEFGTGVSPTGEPARFLHASGATVVDGVLGAHPLMTFGDALYDVETYRRIPFVLENAFDGELATEVLGGLPNVAVSIDPANRALYHSLVSIAGNFPAMLWAEVFGRFERELGLPRELLAPYLFRTLTNVIESGDAALTGPLVRGDVPTIRNHRAALAGTSLSTLYGAFEDFFQSRGSEHV